MVYPVVLAGQRVTAALLTSMLPLEAYKTGATTRTSTAVMDDDPDLFVDLEASATYAVTFELFFGAILAEDIRTEWAVPSGATGFKGVHGPGSTATDANADNIAMRSGVHGFTTDVVYSGVRNDNTLANYVREWGHVTTTNAGVLGLNWAQGTSGLTGTVLFAGSSLIAKRMA